MKRIVFLVAVFVGFMALIAIQESQVFATEDLPPRPPTITPKPIVVGSHIVLEVENQPLTATTLWTVVQWQSEDMSWHDVEGWQGKYIQDRRFRWWVAPKDFGTGPFRWVVYEVEGGEILGISDSFLLPTRGDETIVIKVDLN